MESKNHATCMVREYCLLLRLRIVQKLVDFLEHCVGDLCLFRGNGTDRDQYRAVNNLGIIKEGPQHFLDESFSYCPS